VLSLWGKWEEMFGEIDEIEKKRRGLQRSELRVKSDGQEENHKEKDKTEKES
jgi:hypothetical protein